MSEAIDSLSLVDSDISETEFSDNVPSYKEMGWYKIHGVMDYEQWDEFTIPVLKANRMIPTEEPPQSAFGQRQ